MDLSFVKNIKVHVFFRKALPVQFSIENVFNTLLPFLQEKIKVQYIFSQYPSQGFGSRIRMGINLRKQQGDINHISGDIHFIALFFNRRKTILTIHDCNFINRNTGIKRHLLKLLWLQIPIRFSQIVTTISKASAREIELHTGYPMEQIKIIPNPLSMRFSYVPKTFNPEKPVILQIGTKENKNLPRLIEALKGMACYLEIVGPLTKTLVQLLLGAGIDYRHSVNLSDEELLQKYQECDMLTLVSIEEGFGLPIIEAQAVGRPVVTSSISSMPEIAGGAACLVAPFAVDNIRQGIQRVINDQGYREQLIQDGLKNIKRFEAKNVAKKYTTLYQELSNELE